VAKLNVKTYALAQPAVSSLGTIRLASLIENGSGSGKGRLRQYPSYALVCLLDGHGYYRDSNGVTNDVVPGDLIWVSPSVGHDYGPSQEHFWNEFFVVFDGPIFDLWESKKMFAALPPVQHLEAAHLWVERLRKICQTSTRTPNGSITAIIELQSVLSDLLALQTGNTAPDERWLTSAAHVLEQHSQPNENLSTVAKKFGLSYETFRKKFRLRFGISPQQYRARALTQKAMVLLNQDNLSVKETASRLGFCDEFYFSRAFRKVTGRSPSSFQKRLSQRD
jgi:AraC-like DNA-binding protein